MKKLLIICSLLLAWSIGAQEVFTLDEVISLAKNNNLLIQQVGQELKSAKMEYKSTLKDFLPKVSLEYSANYFNNIPSSMLMSGADSEFSSSATLLVTQPIFTGFALITKSKMSKIGIDVKELEEKKAIMDVVLKAKLSYFNLLATTKIYQASQVAVEQLQEHKNIAQRFYNDGMIYKNDLLKAEVALANAVLTGKRLKGEIEKAKFILNLLLDREIGSDIIISDIDIVETLDLDLPLLLEEAKINRVEIQLIEKAIANKNLELDLVSSKLYPEIVIVGGHSEDSSFGVESDNDFVGIKLKWDFWNWGKTSNQRTSIKYQAVALIRELKAILNNVTVEVKNAGIDLDVAKDSIETSQVALAQATENWQLTGQLYKEGLTNTSEVLDARSFLTTSESNLYQSYYGYLSAIAALEHSLGRL